MERWGSDIVWDHLLVAREHRGTDNAVCQAIPQKILCPEAAATDPIW